MPLCKDSWSNMQKDKLKIGGHVSSVVMMTIKEPKAKFPSQQQVVGGSRRRNLSFVILGRETHLLETIQVNQ